MPRFAKTSLSVKFFANLGFEADLVDRIVAAAPNGVSQHREAH